MPSSSFRLQLQFGFGSSKRFHQMNRWGNGLNGYADKLDAMDLPAPAVEVLRELFFEIGRLIRDGEP